MAFQGFSIVSVKHTKEKISIWFFVSNSLYVISNLLVRLFRFVNVFRRYWKFFNNHEIKWYWNSLSLSGYQLMHVLHLQLTALLKSALKTFEWLPSFISESQRSDSSRAPIEKVIKDWNLVTSKELYHGFDKCYM